MNGKPAYRKRLAFWVAASLAAVVGLGILAGPFRYASVCVQCGAIQRTVEWRIPITDLHVFSRSVESETALSRVLLTNGIVRAHSHHWLFAQGAGAGVKCAIGRGRHVYPAVHRDSFAAVVLALHRRGKVAVRDRLLRGVFDPATSRSFLASAGAEDVGEMSEGELDAWIAEQTQYWDGIESDSPRR